MVSLLSVATHMERCGAHIIGSRHYGWGAPVVARLPRAVRAEVTALCPTPSTR